MKNIARHTVVLFAVILLCAGATAHSAGVDMKEGEWEISTETSMTMGTMSMPSMTSQMTHCLTHDKPVPASEKEKDCKVVDQKVVGNKVSWHIVCKDGEGEGEITYSGTTYKGTFRMKMVEGGETAKKRASRKNKAEDGETMTMNMKLSGRYLGPCPKSQKSGPTGETAKQMAKGQEMAAQAQQQQAQLQASLAANAKKGEALIKRSVVPTEERGACAQEGFGRTPECEGKIGDLNLKPGEYEITVERGSRIGTTYTPVETERKTVCLTEDEPVPGALGAGRPTHVKRGKERIAWTDAAGGRTTKGGILYRGNSLEGAVTTTMDLGAGQQSLSVAKVTGNRTGDGNCIGGRDYSAKKKGGDSATGEGKILKDPVKGIKNLFGF
jgi:Protein of unknown function (DUF3617)